jgi:hypothetical protein
MPIADLLRKVIAAGSARDPSTIKARRLRDAKCLSEEFLNQTNRL